MKILFSALVAAFGLNLCVSATKPSANDKQTGKSKATAPSVKAPAPNYNVFYCIPIEQGKDEEPQEPVCPSEPLHKMFIVKHPSSDFEAGELLLKEDIEKIFRNSKASAALKKAKKAEQAKNPEIKFSKQYVFRLQDMKKEQEAIDIERKYLISGPQKYYFWKLVVPVLGVILALLCFYFFGGSFAAVGQGLVNATSGVQQSLSNGATNVMEYLRLRTPPSVSVPASSGSTPVQIVEKISSSVVAAYEYLIPSAPVVV